MSVRPKTTKIVWLAQGLPAMRGGDESAPPVQARSIVLWALIAVVLTVSALWIAASQLRPRRRIIVRVGRGTGADSAAEPPRGGGATGREPRRLAWARGPGPETQRDHDLFEGVRSTGPETERDHDLFEGVRSIAADAGGSVSAGFGAGRQAWAGSRRIGSLTGGSHRPGASPLRSTVAPQRRPLPRWRRAGSGLQRDLVPGLS